MQLIFLFYGQILLTVVIFLLSFPHKLSVVELHIGKYISSITTKGKQTERKTARMKERHSCVRTFAKEIVLLLYIWKLLRDRVFLSALVNRSIVLSVATNYLKPELHIVDLSVIPQ